MSIDYQFSAMPAEWLLTNKINPTDKFVLAVLILKSNENTNHTYKQGFDILSAQTGISRRQCIYITNKLKSLKFIDINSHTRPVEIRVCLEYVGGRIPDGVKSATDCTLYQTKSATDCTNTQNKECNLQQQRVQFDAKKSATDCTHNRYLDISRNTRACAREEMATSDVADVRSMPNAGQAGENTQQGIDQVENLEAKTLFTSDFQSTMKLFLQTFQNAFCADWYTGKQKNELYCYGETKFLRETIKRNFETWANWFSNSGISIFMADFRPDDDEKIDTNLILKGA